MNEYTIIARETISGTFYIRANSEEEALQKFNEMTEDGGYRDMMENVDSFTTEIVEHRVMDGTDIETGYISEMDMTVIIQYTYKAGVPIAEQIIGFYHGEPNDKDTKEYVGKGIAAIMV